MNQTFAAGLIAREDRSFCREFFFFREEDQAAAAVA